VEGHFNLSFLEVPKKKMPLGEASSFLPVRLPWLFDSD
jgi:hypothetical protein